MDTKSYLGAPYEHLGHQAGGCDCLGLVRWVYQEELGITLPDPGTYAEEWTSIDVIRIVRSYMRYGFYTVKSRVLPFDIIVLKSGADSRLHLGLVTSIGYFLHATSAGVICQSYSQGAHCRNISAILRLRR